MQILTVQVQNFTGGKVSDRATECGYVNTQCHKLHFTFNTL